MENPSLQIGDNNWAVKDGSILGYNILEGNYLPQPINFTRASSATRVNAEGLIETASVISPTELVTNGNFATDSDWVKASGWTISGGSANTDGTFAYAIYQNAVTTIGKKYKYSFEILNSAGGVIDGRFRNRNGGSILNFSSEGTYSGTFVADGLEVNFITLSLNTTSWSIDNVSVKEVIENNVPRIDYTGGGCGKLLLEKQSTNIQIYSEDSSQWTSPSDGLTVVYNTTETLDPSGLNGAEKVTSVSGNKRMFHVSSVAAGSFTVSVFVKKGTADIFNFTTTSGSLLVEFNITTGAITNTTGTGTIKEYSNGWYRVAATGTSAGGNEVVQYKFPNDAGEFMYFYGAQLEFGSYPTSYIPTTTTAVTRVKDETSTTIIPTMTGVSEFTWFFDNTDMDVLVGVVVYMQLNLSGGALRYYSTNGGRFRGSTYFGDVDAIGKLAVKCDGTTLSMFKNGVKSASTLPSALGTFVNFSGFNQGSESFSGGMQSMMLFPTALSDAEIIALTTL